MSARAGRAPLHARCILVAATAACLSCAADAPAPGGGEPERIVSLVPAASEILAELGASDRIVGRAVDDPTIQVRHAPAVGQVLAPSLEAVLALRPDLVVVGVEAPPALRTALERALPGRITVLGIHRLSHVATVVVELGARIGAPAAAERLAARIERELSLVRSAVVGRPAPAVLWIVSARPRVAAGPGTFLDDLLGVAGGRNVLASATAPWPVPSTEALAILSPDVIVWTAHGAPDLSAWPLPKSGAPPARVHALDPDLVHRPGPRVGLIARRLAAALHPGLDFLAAPASTSMAVTPPHPPSTSEQEPRP